MDRAQKEQLVASLHQVFQGAQLVVITHQSGLSVAEISNLRRQMRDAGASFRVTKNRLTRLALDGTPYQGLVELFQGPTAIAYSEDPIAAAKVAVEFAKKNGKLSIVGGGLGEKILNEGEVRSLAALPSLDELRGRLVGMLTTPATRIAGVLQAPAGQLARVLSARAESSEAA